MYEASFAPASLAQTQVTQTILGLVVDWVEALHSKADFEETLAAVMTFVGADSVVLVRGDRRTEGFRRILHTSREAGRLFDTAGNQILVGKILGSQLYKARAGSVWRLTDRRFESDRIDDTLPHGLSEAYAVVLGNGPYETDFLEFVFHSAPPARAQANIQQLAATFSASWGRRTTGIVQRLLLGSGPRAVEDAGPQVMPILDPSNPAGLSRSEFRVCSLVREGMTSKSIARELNVNESTVRAHLSSIYGKTGTSGMVELVHRLTTFAAPAPLYATQ